MGTKDKVKQELEQIQKEHGGVLHPQHVVDFARNKNSALHSRFEWDDGKAAKAYRIVQARQLIRVYVQVAADNVTEVRAFVSLPSDREAGGGYRSTDSVMTDEQRRAELLQMALKELAIFRRKYATLEQLAQVFAAAEAVEGKAARTRGRKAS